MRLQGKTAVITGGSTGIGFETARQFLAEGARVIVTGQNAERLSKAVAELGDGAIGVRADARSIRDAESLAARVEAEFGKLDILFANAGIARFAPLEQFDESAFDDVFGTNVKGVFFTVQKLSPVLADGASVILNASSGNAKGAAMSSVYFATKAAVRSLVRSLAVELGARNIRINALSPGVIPTELANRAGLPPEAVEGFKKAAEATPLGRLGKTTDIARAVVYLASDESSYMTAADFVIDGGYMNV